LLLLTSGSQQTLIGVWMVMLLILLLQVWLLKLPCQLLPRWVYNPSEPFSHAMQYCLYHWAAVTAAAAAEPMRATWTHQAPGAACLAHVLLPTSYLSIHTSFFIMHQLHEARQPIK